MQRNLTFLGIPLIRVKKTEKYEKRYFLGIQYKIKKYARRYNSFVEAFNDNAGFIQNKKIKVITNNLGEALIYARTTPFWVKKDMLVFGVKPQHMEIFKMYAPEVPVFYCGEGSLPEDIDCGSNHFSPLLPVQALISLNSEGKSFWEQWAKYLNVDFKNLKFEKAKICDQDRLLAMKKLNALGINTEKYIFLSPKARSFELLPDSFWKDIEDYLRGVGYDFVYNSTIFSVAEAYVIAEHAKAIISLRSGFNDVLSEIQVPQYLIYAQNSWHGDLQPMYSLKFFPWAAHDFIKEYNTHTETLDDIKNDIIKSIKVSG